MADGGGLVGCMCTLCGCRLNLRRRPCSKSIIIMHTHSAAKWIRSIYGIYLHVITSCMYPTQPCFAIHLNTFLRWLPVNTLTHIPSRRIDKQAVNTVLRFCCARSLSPSSVRQRSSTCEVPHSSASINHWHGTHYFVIAFPLKEATGAVRGCSWPDTRACKFNLCILIIN